MTKNVKFALAVAIIGLIPAIAIPIVLSRQPPDRFSRYLESQLPASFAVIRRLGANTAYVRDRGTGNCFLAYLTSDQGWQNVHYENISCDGLVEH